MWFNAQACTGWYTQESLLRWSTPLPPPLPPPTVFAHVLAEPKANHACGELGFGRTVAKTTTTDSELWQDRDRVCNIREGGDGRKGRCRRRGKRKERRVPANIMCTFPTTQQPPHRTARHTSTLCLPTCRSLPWRSLANQCEWMSAGTWIQAGVPPQTSD